MIIGKFNIKVQQKVPQSRQEIFKYDDVEGQKRFKELTSQNILSKCFGEVDIVKDSEKWLKEFKNILHRSFKKVRIGRGKAQINDIVDKMKAKHELLNELELENYQ